jgi:hypothetical protein
MKKRPANGAIIRRMLTLMLQKLRLQARTMLHEVLVELRRLNSARLGSDELSRLTPRNRVRAVKASLAAHHAKRARCC